MTLGIQQRSIRFSLDSITGQKQIKEKCSNLLTNLISFKFNMQTACISLWLLSYSFALRLEYKMKSKDIGSYINSSNKPLFTNDGYKAEN